MMGLNMAPGLDREFISDSWKVIPKNLWWDARKEAHDAIREDVNFKIYGYDIDEEVIKIARQNAELANVADYIHFEVKDARDIKSEEEYGFIITNPPYGERLEDKETVKALYSDMGRAFKKLDTWSYFVITSFAGFEVEFGKIATRKKKII